MLIQTLGFIRRGGAEEIGTAALFAGAVQSKLAHHQNAASDGLQPQIHFIVFVGENAKTKQLPAELFAILLCILGTDTQKDQKPAADPAGNNAIHLHRSGGDSCQNRPHQLLPRLTFRTPRIPESRDLMLLSSVTFRTSTVT